MIKVENLVKHYGDVQALRSINFEVHDGEIIGFLGANGAGKSTTLKIMTSFIAPTSGNVYVDNLNILEHSLAIRKRVGYLPELNPLYGEMKVYDLLEFTAKIRGIEGKSFKKAFSRVVDQCGLEGVIHRPIADCSKGYKQRIGLATAIIHDPKILILDEPVSGLDPNQIVEIRELIKHLGQEKMVVISSHILQEIEVTVDRIIIIHQGKIVADGTSQELMSGFHGKVQLTLEIKNATEESIKALPEKVADITLLNESKVNDHVALALEYPKEKDPREALFQYALASNWVILEMTPHRAQLEDIFRMLTIEGGADA